MANKYYPTVPDIDVEFDDVPVEVLAEQVKELRKWVALARSGQLGE